MSFQWFVQNLFLMFSNHLAIVLSFAVISNYLVYKCFQFIYNIRCCLHLYLLSVVLHRYVHWCSFVDKCKSSDCSDLAVSSPEPGPLFGTASVQPVQMLGTSAICCYLSCVGVDFLEPLNLAPADDHETTFPFSSAIEIIVLINVE